MIVWLPTCIPVWTVSILESPLTGAKEDGGDGEKVLEGGRSL